MKHMLGFWCVALLASCGVFPSKKKDKDIAIPQYIVTDNAIKRCRTLDRERFLELHFYESYVAVYFIEISIFGDGKGYAVKQILHLGVFNLGPINYTDATISFSGEQSQLETDQQANTLKSGQESAVGFEIDGSKSFQGKHSFSRDFALITTNGETLPLSCE